MKVNVEVDCTPAEARAFLGLPDVAPLNEARVAELQKRMQHKTENERQNERQKARQTCFPRLHGGHS